MRVIWGIMGRVGVFQRLIHEIMSWESVLNHDTLELRHHCHWRPNIEVWLSPRKLMISSIVPRPLCSLDSHGGMYIIPPFNQVFPIISLYAALVKHRGLAN